MLLKHLEPRQLDNSGISFMMFLKELNANEKVLRDMPYQY
jgi:hypothetical protein